MYTTVEASKEINLKPDTFRKRAKMMFLVPRIEGKVFMWNDKQVDAVQKYKRKVSLNKFRYSRKKINIVDFYLTHSHNTQLEIADSMDISVAKVNTTLNEYLETGHIVVASKINVDNFF